MSTRSGPVRLRLLPASDYAGVNRFDPIRFYHWPILGQLYRKRVELCLSECTGGERVLEVGFGSGLTFLNLSEMYEEIYGLDLTASPETVSALFRARQIQTRLQNGNVLDMPYDENHFDTVLLISILEHLKPIELPRAFEEIKRVLKPGGQVVYGAPVERPLMVFLFRLLGYNIRDHHFSTERDVSAVAEQALAKIRMVNMYATPSLLGPIYEVGHFVKANSFSLVS